MGAGDLRVWYHDVWYLPLFSMISPSRIATRLMASSRVEKTFCSTPSPLLYNPILCGRVENKTFDSRSRPPSLTPRYVTPYQQLSTKLRLIAISHIIVLYLLVLALFSFRCVAKWPECLRFLSLSLKKTISLLYNALAGSPSSAYFEATTIPPEALTSYLKEELSTDAVSRTSMDSRLSESFPTRIFEIRL